MKSWIVIFTLLVGIAGVSQAKENIILTESYVKAVIGTYKSLKDLGPDSKKLLVANQIDSIDGDTLEMVEAAIRKNGFKETAHFVNCNKLLKSAYYRSIGKAESGEAANAGKNNIALINEAIADAQIIYDSAMDEADKAVAESILKLSENLENPNMPESAKKNWRTAILNIKTQFAAMKKKLGKTFDDRKKQVAEETKKFNEMILKYKKDLDLIYS